MIKTPYVVGFAFHDRSHMVLLIEKNRPDWQKGILNGIGGHIDEGETPVQAMVREFFEETGLKTEPADWKQLCIITNRLYDGLVYFFYSVIDIGSAKNMTDERLVPILDYTVSTRKVFPNLNWLIPFAAHRIEHPEEKVMLEF